MIKRMHILVAGALFAAALTAQPALADIPNQPTCGVNVTGGLSQTFIYDPFTNTSNVTNLPLSLTLEPWQGTSSNRKTQQVNFIFIRPPGSPNIQINFNGANVVYETPNYQGHPVNLSQQLGEINYNFTGNQTTYNLSGLTITIPPNANIAAGTTIPLQIRYVCKGTGGLPNVDTPVNSATFATISIEVLSGAQATYVGPALAFGEVGNRTDTDVTTTPIIRDGNVRVASSGPYDITMTSQNGYRMSYAGGNPAIEQQNLRYQATFLGQTRTPDNTTPITRTCTRAGLGAPPLSGGVLLPVSVRILEGGTDEVPSANYQDNLIVTVAPLAATTPGVSCP